MRRYIGVALALGAVPAPAVAFPWMVSHGYSSCGSCHVDPSGGSALTGYGRAQGWIHVVTPYNRTAEEPPPVSEFAFGAVTLPEVVIAQADVRTALVPRPGDVSAYLMQADLRGGVATDRFTAYASAGVVSEGAEGSWLLQDPDLPVHPVSREHWLGFRPSRSLMIRAGRMNLPFGIRTDEHITYTRGITRTTVNDDQQLGAALAWTTREVRGEVMLIAGNFALSPDDFRERGYSGYVGLTPTDRLDFGLTSLIAAAAADRDTLQERLRQAHGLYGRWGATERIALLGEVDALLDSGGGDATAGFVGVLSGDLEPTQGVHLKAGGEVCDPVLSDDSAAAGKGWTAVQWFFAPHVNVRLDALYGALYCTPGTEARPMAVAQLHGYL